MLKDVTRYLQSGSDANCLELFQISQIRGTFSLQIALTSDTSCKPEDSQAPCFSDQLTTKSGVPTTSSDMLILWNDSQNSENTILLITVLLWRIPPLMWRYLLWSYLSYLKGMKEDTFHQVSLPTHEWLNHQSCPSPGGQANFSWLKASTHHRSYSTQEGIMSW